MFLEYFVYAKEVRHPVEFHLLKHSSKSVYTTTSPQSISRK